MAEQSFPESTDTAALRSRLAELSQLLRDAEQLEPETRQELADLVDELSQAVAEGRLEPSATAQLAASAAHMAEALRQQHHGPFAAARDGLERIVIEAEDRAPVATGFAERLIDILSSIGS
jgi:predicted RNA-binding protein associated with RNAse of E/G family